MPYDRAAEAGLHPQHLDEHAHPVAMEAPEPVPVEQHEASAIEQLTAFLDDRHVGVFPSANSELTSPRRLFWVGDRECPDLTEAEVRRLTSLFVLLALEMTEKPEPVLHPCLVTACACPDFTQQKVTSLFCSCGHPVQVHEVHA